MSTLQNNAAFRIDEGRFDLSARTIAYFSMEIALAPTVPTYSGGLGMLAGDTLRSAADTGAPMVAVSAGASARLFPTAS